MLYLIGYSTFLFLSVTVGSSILYRRKREAHYQNQLMVDCYVPVSYTHLDVYKRQEEGPQGSWPLLRLLAAVR